MGALFMPRCTRVIADYECTHNLQGWIASAQPSMMSPTVEISYKGTFIPRDRLGANSPPLRGQRLRQRSGVFILGFPQNEKTTRQGCPDGRGGFRIPIDKYDISIFFGCIR